MSKSTIKNQALKPLEILTGKWKTTGRHPMLPGVTLKGETSFEWIENGAFLLMRNHIDHKDFPDGTAIFGSDDKQKKFHMIYFDERNVSRKYNATLKNKIWKWWRNDKEFSQRFTCNISKDGNSIISKGKMSRNGKEWEKDLQLTYKKVKTKNRKVAKKPAKK